MQWKKGGKEEIKLAASEAEHCWGVECATLCIVSLAPALSAIQAATFAPTGKP
jgi:hypothetical protein